MPEPLSALSAATAIVQCIDFGSKLLLAGYGACKAVDGTTEENTMLATVSADLKLVDERLSQQQAGKRYAENWCKDLLRVNVSQWPKIELTHRTAADFIMSDAFPLLMQRAGEDHGTAFAPHPAYCRQRLRSLKCIDFNNITWQQLSSLVRPILSVALDREMAPDPSLHAILDELDRACSLQWRPDVVQGLHDRQLDIHLYFAGNPGHWTDVFRPVTSDGVKKCSMTVLEDDDEWRKPNRFPFLTFAAFYGIAFYVQCEANGHAAARCRAFHLRAALVSN